MTAVAPLLAKFHGDNLARNDAPYTVGAKRQEALRSQGNGRHVVLPIARRVPDCPPHSNHLLQHCGAVCGAARTLPEAFRLQAIYGRRLSNAQRPSLSEMSHLRPQQYI